MNPSPSTPEATEAPAPHRLKLDANGRLLPRTDEERAADAERIQGLAESLASIPDDDPPGSDQEFWRAIDSHRPHRPLFEGLY